MGLRAKFNLVLIAAFAVGLAVAALLAWQSTAEVANRQMLNEAKRRFLPHSVPSFAAQAVLRTVEKEFPDYSYKEAALNPTNPADRATAW
jgi:protein-histidine pros-kinase